MIDIILTKTCTICRTETNLRYFDGFLALDEHKDLDIRIDPNEFSLCPTCGNPQRLHIQAYPYDLTHHQFDTQIHKSLYMQQFREKNQSAH